MYALKQSRSRQRLTMTISCGSRSDRSTSSPRKPSAESTRPMRFRNARTKSSALSAPTRRRDIDTYTARHCRTTQKQKEPPVRGRTGGAFQFSACEGAPLRLGLRLLLLLLTLSVELVGFLRHAGAEVLVGRLERSGVLRLLALAELRGADRVLVLLISLGLVLLGLCGNALAIRRVGVLRTVGLREGLAVVRRGEVSVRLCLLSLAVLRSVGLGGFVLGSLFLRLARDALAKGVLVVLVLAPSRVEVRLAGSSAQRLAFLRGVLLVRRGRRVVSNSCDRQCHYGCQRHGSNNSLQVNIPPEE